MMGDNHFPVQPSKKPTLRVLNHPLYDDEKYIYKRGRKPRKCAGCKRMTLKRYAGYSHIHFAVPGGGMIVKTLLAGTPICSKKCEDKAHKESRTVLRKEKQ
jgi:hypothetical protein